MLVAHADWSAHAGKRWMARATLRPNGRYLAFPPSPVGPPGDLWTRLGTHGRALLGVDFALGLPAAYAARAGIEDFVAELPRFGAGRWRDFYSVATTPGEISLARPFYPDRPGRRRRAHLLDGLGLDEWSALHRRCDHPTPSRPAACPLFWTLGASQVGKAAISGWHDLLAPALRRGLDLALWPFHGTLDHLIRQHRLVVAETYPGEVYGHLGLALRATAASGAPSPGEPTPAACLPGRRARTSTSTRGSARRSRRASPSGLAATIASMRWSACSGCSRWSAAPAPRASPTIRSCAGSRAGSSASRRPADQAETMRGRLC